MYLYWFCLVSAFTRHRKSPRVRTSVCMISSQAQALALGIMLKSRTNFDKFLAGKPQGSSGLQLEVFALVLVFFTNPRTSRIPFRTRVRMIPSRAGLRA